MKIHCIIIVILLFLVVISVISVINDKNKEVKIESVADTLSFKDSVYSYILSLNIQHADIVLKQAMNIIN